MLLGQAVIEGRSRVFSTAVSLVVQVTDGLGAADWIAGNAGRDHRIQPWRALLPCVLAAIDDTRPQKRGDHPYRRMTLSAPV